MANYILSNKAKADLIRIHHWGVERFGEAQADKYYLNFFDCFEKIVQQPLSYESVDYIKKGYRRCAIGYDSIYYKVNNDIIEIMAIVGRQDLKNIL